MEKFLLGVCVGILIMFALVLITDNYDYKLKLQYNGDIKTLSLKTGEFTVVPTDSLEEFIIRDNE